MSVSCIILPLTCLVWPGGALEQHEAKGQGGCSGPDRRQWRGNCPGQRVAERLREDFMLVPRGRQTAAPHSAVPSGLVTVWALVPDVETLGYCRMSLRDKHLAGVGL